MSCVASLASLFICRSTALRAWPLRPQLKRDPLGSPFSMTVSRSSVVLVSALLVCCARSIERTEPMPLYPVHGAVVDSVHGLPPPHARVGVAHGGSRTRRLSPDQRVPVDSLGVFTRLLPAGRHRISAEAMGVIARGAVVGLPGDSARTLRLSLPWQVIKLGTWSQSRVAKHGLEIAGGGCPIGT